MNPSHCPECFSELLATQVAPCWQCGHHEHELLELQQGLHTYAEYLGFGALPIVLCDFCHIDFGSYHAEHFGMGRGLVGQVLEFRRDIDPAFAPNKDKYCPDCNCRLAFAEFTVAAIALAKAKREALDLGLGKR